MLGHIGLNVADLRAASAYYDEIMPLLGFEPCSSSDDEFAFRFPQYPPPYFATFWIDPFSAASRSSARRSRRS